MHAFDVAAQTVAEALQTGQIGTPVAARVVAALTADHGRIEHQLARILEACADWLGSRPDQLTAFGGVESGQVSALARFEGGATTLIAVWADVEPWTAPRRDPEDPMGMWATPRPEPFTPRPKQAWSVPSPLRANDDIKRFLDCIEAGRASDVPAALAAEATEVLLAAYRSAAKGEVVTLPLPRGEE